jgi:mRNA interferase RelE/StbE
LTYELLVERRARRQLESLPEDAYLQIEQAIDGLAEEPRPHGARKLRGHDYLWRKRVGRYRVIYAVFDKDRLIRIVFVALRREDTYDI